MRRTIALILISICMAGTTAECGGTGSGTHGGGTQGGGSQGPGSLGGGQAAGSQSAGSPGGGTEHTMSVMRQLAHCIRSHGMLGWPDPVLNPLTELPDWPQNAPRVPASIQQACQGVADRLPSDVQQSQPPTPANMQALVRYARCMRAHGVPDWPDPNALGEFPMTTQMSIRFKTRDQPANGACIHEVPGGSQYLRFVGAAAPQHGNG